MRRSLKFSAVFLFSIFLFFPHSPKLSHAEIYISIFLGPSAPFSQDIKVREYDINRTFVRENLLEVNTSLGYETGTRFSYFFNKYFGLESEFSYHRMSVDITGIDTKFKNSNMRQERYSFLISGLARRTFDKFKISIFYFGFGLGAVYSDFDFIQKEWGYGGQLFGGVTLAVQQKLIPFFEIKYLWAPDAGGNNRFPGENLKTSGSPNNNFSNKLFGPHNDTQFLSFLIGTKFKI